MAQIREQKKRSEYASPMRRASGARLLALAGAMAVMELASAQTVAIQPSVTARLTYTDNVAASESNEKGDWIAEVAPGIAISRESGRFSGNLRAQLRNVAYANESDRSTTYLALFGRGQIEAMEQLLFVDMDASLSRNSRSDLLGRASGDFLNDDRDNETRLFSIGPRLEFRFGGDGRGTLRHLSRWLDGGGAIDRRRVEEVHANASDPTSFGRFGWGLNYLRSDTRFEDTADSEVFQETARATLFATVSPQLRLRAIVGHESTDFDVRSGESGTITGVGFDWNPTERTFIAGTVEDRVFGRGYNVSFKHRRPLSTWDLSYSRDISSSLSTFGSVFDDPEFRTVYDGLADIIPDPFEREAFVRELLGFTAPGVRDAFVTTAFFVDRRLRAGVSLVGARNVLSLSLLRSERERLNTVTTIDPNDDFSIFDTVRTDSVTLALNHKLSGLTGLNASAVRSRSKGSGTTRGETRRSVLSVGLNKRFSPRTNGALTYRHQRADGFTDFVENVLTASVAIRF
jgi:uncharacterized protein (PEP-CTERM system associated)